MLLCGWLTHWLADVSKARSIALASGKPPPTLRSYWLTDPYSVALSVIGLVVFYFIMPYVAEQFPELGDLIGATKGRPMNPLAAYLGGYVSPSLTDIVSKRVTKMIG
jgi:hypothetical protein